MDPNLIISPVMGAAIGGFANWLAIQMLFYPLTEKKIFGVRIPFTPGLIPKERKKVAASIADAVANYFLSEEVIVDAVVSPKAEKEFKQYIRELISKQRESKETLSVSFENISGKSIVNIYEENQEKVLNFVEEQIKSKEFIDSISVIIEAEVDQLLEKNLSEFTDDTMNEKLAAKISNGLNSEAFNNFISHTTVSQLQILSESNKKLGEMLPKEADNYIKAKLIANSDKIAQMISDFVTSSSVQFKMRKFLKSSFEGSFKLRMLSKVVDIEKILENVLEELVVFLEQQESRREIANFLLKSIESLESREMKDLFESYGIEVDEENVKPVITALTSSIGDKKNILSLIETSKIASLSVKEILSAIDNSIIEEKSKIVRMAVNSVLKSISVKEILRTILKEKVKELSKVETGIIFRCLDERDIKLVEGSILKNFRKLISGESDRILKVINVSQIVEDRINAFDMGEMEEIMLGIIRKDIATMRAFEAGIGFIIGFIVPLYPYVLRLFK